MHAIFFTSLMGLVYIFLCRPNLNVLVTNNLIWLLANHDGNIYQLTTVLCAIFSP